VLTGLSGDLIFPGMRIASYSALKRDNLRFQPFLIAPHLYYVGASDIAIFALETSAGLIVIDGGYESTAPMVLDNLRTLNLDPKSVRVLLNSHAHVDHAGGLARLKAETPQCSTPLRVTRTNSSLEDEGISSGAIGSLFRRLK